MVNKMIRDDQPRSQRRALVSGLVHGNAPYANRPKELSWCSNINFLEAKAALRTAHSPYVQIGNSIELAAECKTTHDPENPDHANWHRIIAEEFHKMLNRWPERQWHTQFSEKQMLKFGIGPVVFDKKGDWRYRAMPADSVKVPKDSPSCLDERVPYCIILTSYTVLQLWERIAAGDTVAENAGWNVALVKDLIRKHGKGMIGENGNSDWRQISWERFQTELKTNDFATYASNCENIPCATVLFREFNGKISKVIVTEHELGGDIAMPGMAKQPEDGFLFQDIGVFDSYDQALVPFFLDIDEDGLWHSVRGIAEDGYRHWTVLNRLYNRALDAAFIDSSLVLKPGTSRNSDKLAPLVLDAVTYIPPGAELQQGRLIGSMEGVMGMMRFVSNNLANNLGQYNQRTLAREDGRGEQPTATQIDATVSKEAMLSQGQMILLFQTKDKVFAEQFRRAVDPKTSDEEARRFQDRCVERGVPKEAFLWKNMEFVRANRSSGYGSQQMRQLTYKEMLSSGSVAAMPSDGQANFWREFASSTAGADKVDIFFPKQPKIDQDEWMAQMENAAMQNGAEPPVLSGQDDVVHLQIHGEDAANRLEPINEAIEQGAQPDPAMVDEAYRYLQRMGPHFQEHVANLKRNPQRAQMADMFEDQLRNLVSFSSKLRGVIMRSQQAQRQAAQEQQQAVALGAMDQAKLKSAEISDQIKVGKFENDTRIKTMKAAAQMRLQDKKTANDILLSRAKETANAA